MRGAMDALEQIKASAAYQTADVPRCLWPTREQLDSIDVIDLPADATVSLRLSEAFGALPNDLADARLYGEPGRLSVLVEYYDLIEEDVYPLSLTSYLDLVSSRVLNARSHGVSLTYRGRDAAEKLLLEYKVATTGRTLGDHARFGLQCVKALEQAIVADLGSLDRLFSRMRGHRELVTMDEVASVRNAPNAKAKGDRLEELVERLFVSVGGFHSLGRNLRLRNQELDIALENWRTDGAWSTRGRLIIVECKNWDGPAGPADVAALEQKIRDQSGECALGVLASWKGLTKGGYLELDRITRENFRIVTIDGEGITSAVRNGNFDEYLDEICAIRPPAGSRRSTDHGTASKPYPCPDE